MLSSLPLVTCLWDYDVALSAVVVGGSCGSITVGVCPMVMVDLLETWSRFSSFIKLEYFLFLFSSCFKYFLSDLRYLLFDCEFCRKYLGFFSICALNRPTVWIQDFSNSRKLAGIESNPLFVGLLKLYYLCYVPSHDILKWRLLW